MKMRCDLHCHSGYAGGVGNISLDDIESAMPKKGIEVIATGDCLQKQWMENLEENLTEEYDGLFSYRENSSVNYLLQTEIIFTSSLDSNVCSGRKMVHHVFLFPSFDSIRKVREKMTGWNVKLKIGRPFVKCHGKEDVASKLYDIMNTDPFIESFPAHVMTPNGIYGSKNPVNSMEDFYGEGTELINAVETGLSADPIILGQIPELDNYTLLSNSDAHSPSLHRMGREFTIINVKKKSFEGIIDAVRKGGVTHTAEFNPTEGRYFLSGHRANRQGHGDDMCIYSPAHTPQDGICPICNKGLTIGVLERSQILKTNQDGGGREWGYMPKSFPEFVHMVPLVEVIAYTLGVKNPASKKVMKYYDETVRHLGNECDMWFKRSSDIISLLDGNIDEALLNNILEIKKGNFAFDPMGYDGTYGELKVGETSDIFDVKLERIDNSSIRQMRLDIR